jgi:glycosyltransferase involved in cell wall biosynthesis
MIGKTELWRSGVTIAIPVYNEEQFVEAAIRSAVSQCETLLISDNDSTDSSADICKKLSSEFDNIIFVSHAQNLGAVKNFEFLLQSAKTPFFMWLGAHDLIPNDYVRKLRERLDADTSSVLAYGAAHHIDRSGNMVTDYEYTQATTFSADEASTRLMAAIQYLDDCSIVHGLFRTHALKNSWLQLHCLGVDHVLLSRTILHGRFSYAPTTFLARRDVHLQDSASAQLARITGQLNDTRTSYLEMQQHQYGLAVNASQTLGWAGMLYRLRARYWLVHRFGPFGQSRVSALLDKLLYAFSVIWRKFGRLLKSFKPKKHNAN